MKTRRPHFRYVIIFNILNIYFDASTSQSNPFTRAREDFSKQIPRKSLLTPSSGQAKEDDVLGKCTIVSADDRHYLPVIER